MKKLLVLLLPLYFCSFVTPAHASDGFLMSDSVDYKFDSLGLATVTHHFSLTNQTSNLYTKDFLINLKGFNPQKVTASDSSGPLRVSVSDTRYTVRFTKPSVGLGVTHRFTLTYQSQLATHHAQLWEISLPALENSDLFDKYELNLSVPQEFGPPASFSVTPITSKENTYTFSKSQLSRSQVAAVFGNFQIVSFSLRYKTDNSKSIPLPSDSEDQKIFLTDMTPQPENVTMDSSGSWIATFSKTTEISVSGTAYLLSDKPLFIPDTLSLVSRNIQPGSYTPPSYPDLDINWHKPFQFFPLLPISSRLTITNTLPQAVSFLPIAINSPSLDLISPADQLIDILPPMGHVDLPVKLKSPFFPGFSSKFIYFSIGSRSLAYNIESGLFIAWHLILGFILAAIFIALGFIAHYAWGLHHERRLRANSLRGQSQPPS